MREEVVGSLVGRLGIAVSMIGSILEGGTSAVMVVFKWDLKRVLYAASCDVLINVYNQLHFI